MNLNGLVLQARAIMDRSLSLRHPDVEEAIDFVRLVAAIPIEEDNLSNREVTPEAAERRIDQVQVGYGAVARSLPTANKEDFPVASKLNVDEKRLLSRAATLVGEAGRNYEGRVGTEDVNRRTLTMLAVLNMNINRLIEDA